MSQKEAGPPAKHLIQLKLENPNELVYHEEPIFADGKAVGSITSGMYGHRVGASLGMGYVKLDGPITADRLKATRFEVEG